MGLDSFYADYSGKLQLKTTCWERGAEPPAAGSGDALSCELFTEDYLQGAVSGAAGGCEPGWKRAALVGSRLPSAPPAAPSRYSSVAVPIDSSIRLPRVSRIGPHRRSCCPDDARKYRGSSQIRARPAGSAARRLRHHSTRGEIAISLGRQARRRDRGGRDAQDPLGRDSRTGEGFQRVAPLQGAGAAGGARDWWSRAIPWLDK